jgi:hypothetical protein
MSTALILAALPSPSSNAIDVGPLSIRAYGEAIGIGVGARRARELFGRPSDLRWALRIDPQHRPDGFADVATYHRLGLRQRPVVVAASVLPFLVFTGGIAAGADWATWH